MRTDDLGGLRACGVAGEKKRAKLRHGMDVEKREPTQFAGKSDDFPAQCVLKSGVEHQISSLFSASIPCSQFLPSFSMPATPQARSLPRSVRWGREVRGLDLANGQIGVRLLWGEQEWNGDGRWWGLDLRQWRRSA